MRRAPTVPRNENDGGLKASGIGSEFHDCTVRALAIVLDMRYEHAHQLLKVYGRVNGSPFHFYRWMHEPGRHMFDVVEHRAKTVGGFIKTHQQGSYICTIKGHAFAVIDGVIHDLAIVKIGYRTRIRGVWRSAKLEVQEETRLG